MDQHLYRRKRRGPALRLMAALGGLLGLAIALRAEPGEQVLELDTDHSSIEVLVQANVGAFTGKLPRYEADIRIDAAHHVVGGAVVNFTFADLRTGIALRDRHMREWEDAVRYPTVSFHLGSIETAPDNRVTVHGGLVLHGIEHAISFPISVLVADPVYSIDGEAEIDYRDFGLPPIRRFWVITVAPRLVVHFHLQGRLALEPEKEL
jgi:polyisoprenoid-binding protein YceI